jgi:hypothetical protein
MKLFKRYFLFAGLALLTLPGMAHINPELTNAAPTSGNVSFRNDCAQATQQIEMSINNVRATLLNGGDVWWDLRDGKYIVPKVDPASGITPVSSIFAGAVWIGGYDDVGNLKMAAQTYRNATHTDFWPGPLTSLGTTAKDTCKQWDRFFRVYGENIRTHIRAFEESKASGVPMDCDAIPQDIRAWPGRGNPYFFQINGWELPFDSQGLGAFHDEDGDEEYDPCQGDYPVIEVRGCDAPNFPDEMIFWVYNDAGNIHTNSQGDPIRMEVQVQAFAYATNDEINDMTFQRYKLINRATAIIDSCFFAMWVDADLGCYTDDYIGCDTSRSLMYVYNEDALDGTNGCDCLQGVPTYCREVPMLGIDYFRGPRKPLPFCDTVALNWVPGEEVIFISSDVPYQDSLRIVCGEFRGELGMSSFTYYNNGSVGNWPNAMTDPQPGAPLEFYRYISGSWKDGRPFCFGGSGYTTGPGCVAIQYAFPDPPNQASGWSMATAGLAFGDRRTLQATGPLRLDPGEVNELIIGAVWVPDVPHPNPDPSRLFSADGIAQSLFDNCFILPDGPDAPDLDFIELDRELIMILTNDIEFSNNAFELYSEKGLEIPDQEEDSLYVFEGYKIYQLRGPDVIAAEKDDINKSRLIFQVDVRNGVRSIYNWHSVPDPNPLSSEPIWIPELRVQGADAGIRHTFRITEDQFAQQDRRLINHKKYYFLAVAYGYNNYDQFDPKTTLGQRRPYLEGRRNVKLYTALPRPIVFTQLNSVYGLGPTITRLSGIGAGGNFLSITEESRIEICMGTNNGIINYLPGGGPIEAKIYNPLIIQDGCYILEFADNDGNPAVLAPNAYWKLYPEDDPSKVLTSERSIETLNEQIIAEFGFSVTLGQTADVGDRADERNGTIGVTVEYADPNGVSWLFWMPEGGGPGAGGFLAPVFDFLKNEDQNHPDFLKDPERGFNRMDGFYPFHLVDYIKAQPVENQLGFMVTPGWLDPGAATARAQPLARLQNLNNVDIVLTKDKSKWSRCIVVETANSYFTDLGLTTAGGSRNMERRNVPSVTQHDNDNDGLPDVDPNEPMTGFGWFPGYAVDVESGKRLNIFFGENSIYNDAIQEVFPNYPANGDDMMWNPSSHLFTLSGGFPVVADIPMGGMHYVYVTQTPYDGCAALGARLRPNGSNFDKFAPNGLPQITWTGIPLAFEDELLSYADGLIPNDVVIQIRVDNPYQMSQAMGSTVWEYPKYRICFDGVEATPRSTDTEINEALAKINVVPNPYYGYSAYEVTTLSTTVKITNLPANCVVTIYSIDGRFIRQYKRNEAGVIQSPPRTNPPILETQINPDIEWDLKNSKGIPIASGVYLIHVNAPGLGEHVIKWFGINRQFDPSGL